MIPELTVRDVMDFIEAQGVNLDAMHSRDHLRHHEFIAMVEGHLLKGSVAVAKAFCALANLK